MKEKVSPLTKSPVVMRGSLVNFELSSTCVELLMYLELERGRSANTIAAYRSDLARFEIYLENNGLELAQVSEQVLYSFMAEMSTNGLSARSSKRVMSCIGTLFRYLSIEGTLGTNPVEHVETPKAPKSLPKALSIAQVETLIESVDTNSIAGLRDKAILEVAYATGARVSELCSLNIDSVDLEESTAILTGKGDKQRIVPLGAMANIALAAWLDGPRRELVSKATIARTKQVNSKRSNDLAMFLNLRATRITRQGIWSIMRGYSLGVGLSDVMHPHVLRHSCATHMLNNGADIRIVQEMLGHASLATTQIYTKVAGEAIRAIYMDAHPRSRG